MKDYFDQDNLDEFLNEMKANRTKPSKESGERKSLRKAWTKKSRDRIFNHPSKMAHGMSMTQKKDAKSQGFSNVPQMQYYQKKKKSGLVARDGEEQVEEGSLGAKKSNRMVKSKDPSIGSAGAEKAINRNNKKKFIQRKREKLPIKDKPDARADKHGRLNRAADSRRTAQMKSKFGKDNFMDKADAYADLDRVKNDRKVEEGSIGVKKYLRRSQASGQAVDKYLKNMDSDDAYYNKTKKIKPGTRQRRKELGDKAEKAGKDALDSASKLAKKKEFKRKQKQEVDEGSLGKKRGERLKDRAHKSISKLYKHNAKRSYEDPNMDEPPTKKDIEIGTNFARSMHKNAEHAKKRKLKGDFRKQRKANKDKQDVDEGSLGQKKIDRRYQAQSKALGDYEKDKNPDSRAKFRKVAKDTYRKALARSTKDRLKRKDEE